MAIATLTPAVFTATKYWSGTSADTSFAQAEQRGVGYLHPLTDLVAALTDAQSAAVASQPVNADAVHHALDEVALADQRDGRALGVHDSWINLQSDVAKLLAAPSTGKTAYSGYSAVVDEALFLAGKVGDTSNLILDPELDTYYLMDASLLRLPALLVDSGRMVDLNALRQVGGSGVDLSQVLVARDRVSTESVAVQTSLSKSFNSSASPIFGPDLLTKIDAFRTATGALAPSTSLIDQPLPTDAASLQTARFVLEKTVTQLDGAALDHLNGLLANRLADRDGDRTTLVLVWAAGIGVAGLVAILGSGLLGRRRRREARPGSHAGSRGASARGDDGRGRGGARVDEDGEPFVASRPTWGETTGAAR